MYIYIYIYIMCPLRSMVVTQSDHDSIGVGNGVHLFGF